MVMMPVSVMGATDVLLQRGKRLLRSFDVTGLKRVLQCLKFFANGRVLIQEGRVWTLALGALQIALECLESALGGGNIARLEGASQALEILHSLAESVVRVRRVGSGGGTTIRYIHTATVF